VAEGAKNLPESRQGLVEQRRHRFVSPVARGDSGSSGDQDRSDLAPPGESTKAGGDRARLVLQDEVLEHVMPGPAQGVSDVAAAPVVRLDARVAHGEDGTGDRPRAGPTMLPVS